MGWWGWLQHPKMLKGIVEKKKEKSQWGGNLGNHWEMIEKNRWGKRKV